MVFDGAELAFANHVHDLDAGDQDSGAAKGLESEHRPGDVFDGSMVLFDDLLRYFDWRISMARPLSAWMLTMAAVLKPLLSMMIAGFPIAAEFS